MKEDEGEMMDMMLGVALFFLAFGNAVYLSLEAFRFRSLSTYYEYGKLGSNETNYWELGNTIYLYGGIVIWSLAAVTSILEFFVGAANMQMVWGLGVFFGIPLISFIYGILTFMSYNKAYEVVRDSKDATKLTTAYALINMIKIEWNAYGVRELGTQLTFWELSSMKEGDGKYKKQAQQGKGGKQGG